MKAAHAAQNKELCALAHEVATEATEPIKTGVSKAFNKSGRCLSAGVLLVRRHFAVPDGAGLLSARHALGGARARTGPDSCRALVSTRNCLLAGLCEVRV